MKSTVAEYTGGEAIVWIRINEPSVKKKSTAESLIDK